MSGSGTLTISTRVVSGEKLLPRFSDASFSRYVLLEVRDTGSGMSQETLQHIFEPFYTTKESGKGTGLGLAVVFGVMQNHEGFIDVETELHKGTAFKLYFPVKSSQSETQKEVAIQGECGSGRETILLVEDEELLRALATEVLTAKGYRILIAADGEEALEVFTKNRQEITLVVSDLGLPKLSGKDVLKKVKEMEHSVRFIIATGFLEPEEKSDLYRCGASEIIPKPYTPKELSRKVREVLDA